MVTLTVDKDQIGAIIGPSGKIIQDIQRNLERLSLLKKWVIRVSWILPPMQNLSRLPLPASRLLLANLKSERFTRSCKTITAFGAFVSSCRVKTAVVARVQIDHKRVEKVEDVLKEGDRVRVKLIDIDPKTGKFKLSIRCCCLNRKVWSKTIVKIVVNAKIEANRQDRGLDKIGRSFPSRQRS